MRKKTIRTKIAKMIAELNQLIILCDAGQARNLSQGLKRSRKQLIKALDSLEGRKTSKKNLLDVLLVGMKLAEVLLSFLPKR